MKLPPLSKYPRLITIGGEPWRVEFVRQIKKSRQTLGLCEFSEKTIYIRRGQSRKETFATFVHECLHALEEEYNFELKHKHIYALEQGIVELLIENF